MAGGAAPGPPGPPLFRLFSSGDPVVPSHPRVAGMRTPTVGAPRREGGPAPLSPSDRCGAHLRDGKGPPRAGAPTAGASGVQADWVPLPLRVPGSWGRLGLPSFGGGARARARPSSPWGQPAEISALRGRAALAAHPGVRKPREPRGSAGPNTSRERAGARCGPPPCPTVLLHARSGARAPAPGASVGRRWDPTYRPLAGASVTPAALPAWVADFFSSGLPGRRPRPPPRRVATFEGHREARGEGGPEGARPVWLPPSFFGVGRGTGGKKSSERAPAPALLPDSPGCHPEHRGMRGERGPREVPRGSRRPPLALPPSLSLSPAGFDPQPPGGGV